MLELRFKNRRHDLLKSYCEKEPNDILVKESARLIGENGKSVGYIFKSWDKEGRVSSAVRNMKYLTNRRTDGMSQNANTFGFMPRNAIRCNYCRPSKLLKENPKAWNALWHYSEVISGFIKATDPEIHERNKIIIDQMLKPCWKMGNSIFTSGIVNKNNHLRYHVDFGNFEGTWSAMLAYRNDIKGGNLHLPEFEATLAIEDGDLLIFQGSDIVHGVTPIISTGPKPERFTVVYYALEQLKKCLEPKEEMERYKKWATESFFNKKQRMEELKRQL